MREKREGSESVSQQTRNLGSVPSTVLGSGQSGCSFSSLGSLGAQSVPI